MTQAEKYQMLINDCISKMSVDDQKIYGQIAECAVELGYTPKPVKTAQGVSDTLTFTKSKVKRTLIKISPNKNGKSGLTMSFFATPVYSEIFHRGIKKVIEEFNGRYTGCYGCGRCKNGLHGYTYVYPDGKKVFRCGGELIRLPPIEASHVDEIKTMMKTQDDFWLRQSVVTDHVD